MECGSLALPVDAMGVVEEEVDVPEHIGDDGGDLIKMKQRENAVLEGRQGYELWRSIDNVVNL